MQDQYGHKAYENNQIITNLTKGPLHKMELIPDTAWVTKNQRLDSPGT